MRLDIFSEALGLKTQLTIDKGVFEIFDSVTLKFKLFLLLSLLAVHLFLHYFLSVLFVRRDRSI